ncbi:MAG TPA: glycoside hydrolase family 15 protein [Thermomicrobiales bacterium]|nr:glycoside hydrolase family 15 protein [Thermomicrobiales bacterium]
MSASRHDGAETREHEVVTIAESRSGGYRPIAEYAAVGDAQSLALINSDGGVDWLCLPHFDSPAVLCRILDVDKGGYLAVRPSRPVVRVTRRYRPNSTILETTFETGRGRLRITDTMPVAADDPDALLDGVWSGTGRHRLIRLLEALDGPIDVVLDAKIAFDYGLVPATVELVPGQGARLSDESGRMLGLTWPGALEAGDQGGLKGDLTVGPGQPIACVLDWVEDQSNREMVPKTEDWIAQIAETDGAWNRWASGLHIQGRYQNELLRSALTLKLLTFEPTGAIIAAPTTSLPEDIGGVRNWDYRYCWLRDATFTLYALLQVGDDSAASAFWGWIERTCANLSPAEINIMYTIRGDGDLTERTLDHLSGYRDSRPVRVGNGAWDQRQIDVYGELIDAFWFYHHWAREHGWDVTVRAEVWGLIRATADYICQIWREKDRGIWEIRGDPQHFVYSKVMCWVGLDRAIRFAAMEDPGLDVSRWCQERDAIREEILQRGWNAKVQAFTMAYENEALDASALRMPLVGFLPANDPRMEATIDAIYDHLGDGGLIKRYEANDGLSGGEGAFAICTFWMVDCLTALGRIDDAQALFERMLGYASDLGLFAEEVDPETGAALGNYPQAFTHLALIDAGVDLTAALQRRKAVSGSMEERARDAEPDWRAADD